MKRLAKRFGVGFLVAFLAFGAFTTFVPAKYSSYHAVRYHFIPTLFAQEESGGGGDSGAGGSDPDCDCNQWWTGWEECNCGVSCNHQSWGCGPFWALACNGINDGGGNLN